MTKRRQKTESIVSAKISPASDDNSRAYAVLSAAALAIPMAMNTAGAGTPVPDTSVQYHASRYQESDLDKDNLAGGSASRFEIDSHSVQLLTPVGRASDLAINITAESMSGASPWYIRPDSQGKPVQIMTGASISEERTDFQTYFRHFFDSQTSAKVIAGYSTEDDYEAKNFGLEFEQDFAELQLTVSGGLGVSNDKLSPTDGGVANRIKSATKDSVTSFIGLSQILNARTVVQASLGLSRKSGFLSDPYKRVWIGNNIVADSRPKEREETVGEVRLRHFVPTLKAAIHADYRYYEDDWEISSHTVNISWYQNLAGGWQLTPSIRFYSQKQAEFYAPYFTQAREDGFASSDYRLSPYGASSFRLNVRKDWGPISSSLEYETYKASSDMSLSDVELENPGLVEFDVISLGIKWSL